MIRRGLAALERAMTLSASGRPIGPYVIQAQIAACHARADDRPRRPTGAPSPTGTTCSHSSATTRSSRSTARSPTAAPTAPRRVWRCSTTSPTTDRSPDSHLVDAVRGDLLSRAGRHAEAADSFDRAASLTGNEAERAVLAARAADARSQG